jgi:hypothetical protein
VCHTLLHTIALIFCGKRQVNGEKPQEALRLLVARLISQSQRLLSLLFQ